MKFSTLFNKFYYLSSYWVGKVLYIYWIYFFINYMHCKYFLPVSLFISLILLLKKIKDLILILSNVINFYFIFSIISDLVKKFSLTQSYHTCLGLFYSTSLVASQKVLKSNSVSSSVLYVFFKINFPLDLLHIHTHCETAYQFL